MIKKNQLSSQVCIFIPFMQKAQTIILSLSLSSLCQSTILVLLTCAIIVLSLYYSSNHTKQQPSSHQYVHPLMQLRAHTLIAWPGNVKCQLRAGVLPCISFSVPTSHHLLWEENTSGLRNDFHVWSVPKSNIKEIQVPCSHLPSLFSYSGNSKCQHHYHRYCNYHRHHHYHHYHRRHHHPNTQEMPSVIEGFCWFDPLFPLQPNVGHALKVLAC